MQNLYFITWAGPSIFFFKQHQVYAGSHYFEKEKIVLQTLLAQPSCEVSFVFFSTF